MDSSVTSRRSPIKFFLLVFTIAVPFWLLGALVGTPESFPIKLPLSALQFVSPLISAAVLVYREDGAAGVRGLLMRVTRSRGITLKWLVPITLVMPALYLLAYSLQRQLGRPLPELRISAETIPALLVVFLVTAVAEEAGWTGYALDPMQSRWGALKAAIIIGVIWGVFHLVADLQGAHSIEWIGWHRLGAVALRILIVWAYNNTRQSVVAAVILHAMDNVAWQLTPINGSHYDPAITAPIIALAAVTVTSLWGPATLAHYRNSVNFLITRREERR
jgi:uncharacterized protein